MPGTIQTHPGNVIKLNKFTSLTLPSISTLETTCISQISEEKLKCCFVWIFHKTIIQREESM
jgi:hypothetical protein